MNYLCLKHWNFFFNQFFLYVKGYSKIKRYQQRKSNIINQKEYLIKKNQQQIKVEKKIVLKDSQSSGMQGFNKPLALMCYICGREYGTKSLGIHMKTCMQKWDIEESKKPRNQRRPLPLPPHGLEELLAKPNITAADIQDFNTGAFNKYNNEALVRCPNCNRTFKPEALAHHQKACSKDNPFKPLPGQGGSNLGSQAEFGDNDAANLKPCIFCGRKFAADRIAKHETVCTKMDKTKIQSPTKSLGEIKAGTGGTIRSGGGGGMGGGGMGGGSSASSSYSPVKQPVRPKTLVCFICGRDYLQLKAQRVNQ